MPFRVENRRVVPYSFEFDYVSVKTRIKMSPHQVNKYLKLQSPLKSRKMIISSWNKHYSNQYFFLYQLFRLKTRYLLSLIISKTRA